MTISNDQLDLDCSVIDTADLAGVQGGTLDGGGGTTSTATTTAPKQPTELGNICRTAYTAVGAAIGAEAGGLGSIPGAVIGGVVGRAVCQP